VRKGQEIVVLDRGTPVARLLPLARPSSLLVRPGKQRFAKVKRPPPPSKPVDSLSARGALSSAEGARARGTIAEYLVNADLISLTRNILARAALPLTVSLGTLDALHLTTAAIWREENEALSFATHDAALGLAARSLGFEVHGV
jgi:antitoxin (DNA-binding transcriptional repressor) of toxin-antitoxin stability system